MDHYAMLDCGHLGSWTVSLHRHESGGARFLERSPRLPADTAYDDAAAWLLSWGFRVKSWRRVAGSTHMGDLETA